MRLSAKERESRSKLRQVLAEKLKIWDQRVKDMEIARILKDPGVEEKLVFVRQEQAKLRKELRALSRGVGKQRDWADGKLIYWSEASDASHDCLLGEYNKSNSKLRGL